MNGAYSLIGTADLTAVFFRALLIQASWSFDRLQTAGFAYAIEPALKKLYSDPGEYERRMKFHLDYFNTQPYLASFILGAAVRLEEDRATGRNTDADVAGLKTALMAPLGALGDSFFWGSLLPMAAAAGTAVLMAGFWWAPLVFLALFNIWHVGLRAGTLLWGYRSGGDAVSLMAKYRFTQTAKRFKIMALSVLGAIMGTIPLWRTDFKPDISIPSAVQVFAGLAVMMVLLAIIRRGGSPVKMILGLAAASLVLVYAGAV